MLGFLKSKITSPKETKRDKERISQLEKTVMNLVAANRLPMRKNQSGWNKDRPLSGSPETNVSVYISSPMQYTMANLRARMSKARSYTIVGGTEKTRAELKKIMQNSNMSDIYFHLILESCVFGKSVVEVQKMGVEIDPITHEAKLDPNGKYKYAPLKFEDRKWSPVSAQVVKEMRNDLGTFTYYVYVSSYADVEDDSKIIPEGNPDTIGVFYLNRMAGREFGVSIIDILSPLNDAYDDADSNLGVIAAKYSVGFWVFKADKAWINNLSGAKDYMEKMKTKFDQWKVGNDAYLSPGYDIEPKTMESTGLEAVLLQKDKIWDEAAFVWGLCPETIRGKRDDRTAYEIDTLVSDGKSIEDFLNTELIPRTFDYAPDLPRVQFDPDPDTLVKLAKVWVMAINPVPQYAKKIAEFLGAEYDPNFQSKMGEVRTDPGIQVESHSGPGMFDKTNFSGGKINKEPRGE